MIPNAARFLGRADDYVRYRPSYPGAAIDAIFESLSEPHQLDVLDVGAGTGISTALLRSRGARVVGIDPNGEMREKALANGLDVREGSAEATGFSAARFDVVASFQAFHWFATPEVLAEFARILRPGGRVALVWNERDDRDPFTNAYGVHVDNLRDRMAIAMRATVGSDTGPEKVAALLIDSPFRCVRHAAFPNFQRLDWNGVVGRIRSASYTPTQGEEHVRMMRGVKSAFDAHADRDGFVRFVMRTDVIVGDLPTAQTA